MDPNNMALRYVSQEILIMVSEYLSETDLSSFARTSQPLHKVLNPELYHRNVRDSNSSALRWAAAHDEIATAKLSLAAGASQAKIRIRVSECLLPESMLEVYPCSSKPREEKIYEITPLLIAATYGSECVARLLIVTGADLNECSPISAAAYCGHETMAEFFLHYDIEVDDDFEWNMSPLDFAITYEREALVPSLLPKGAKCDWATVDSVVARGNVNIVRSMLDSNPSMENLVKVMFIAADEEQEEIVNLVLEYDPDLGEVDDSNRNILHFIVNYSWTGLLPIVLDKEIDTETADSRTGDAHLMIAARKDDLSAALLLIERDANIEAKATEYEKGMTPLSIAIDQGFEDLTRMLVGKGADIEAKTDACRTPLMTAITRGYTNIVKLLLESGADVEALDSEDQTPLKLAVTGGLSEVTKLLAEFGANLNAFEKDGSTAIHFAAVRGHLEVLRVLVDPGANIDERDAQGKTPLSIT